MRNSVHYISTRSLENRHVYDEQAICRMVGSTYYALTRYKLPNRHEHKLPIGFDQSGRSFCNGH